MSDLRQRAYRIEGASAAQLVASIERGVAGGALARGERLPSVRRLATDVGLSPVTVAAAVAELRRRGVLVTEPRRGTRVGHGAPLAPARAPLPVPAGVRDLSRGNPDPALLPDLRAALARLRLPVGLYGEPPVEESLIELAREQLRADGVPGERLCVVSGALDGIERVLDAHLRPGDRVAVEDPGYAALFDLLRAHGLVLQAVAMDERGMLPDALQLALERGARAVIITPRAGQNPTGAALDEARAAELRAALRRMPQALVIEDDHLGPVAGVALHTAVTGRERWCATRSVAKSLGPDLRLAVLAGDPLTVDRVQGRQQCGPGWVSHVLQRLVVALWSDAHVRSSIAAAARKYGERRERLLAALAARGLSASGASGLNVWVAVEDEPGAVGGLAQRGWMVAPGAPFRLSVGPGAIRLTIATLQRAETDRLAADVAEVLAARPLRSG